MLRKATSATFAFQVLADVTLPPPPRQRFRCSGSARADELAHSGATRGGRPGRKGTKVQDTIFSMDQLYDERLGCQKLTGHC